MIFFGWSCLVFLCWLLLLSSLTVTAAAAACSGELSQAQFNSLQAVFNSTDGSSWQWDLFLPISTQWSFPNTLSAPCSDSWQGVTCSVASKGFCDVSALSLSGMSLRGTIPADIIHLTELTSLVMDSNQLEGLIPSQLGNLSSLTELDLYSNSLTGTIPSTLGKLSALSKLLLGLNSLTKTIPSQLGSLSSLIWLEIYSNCLTGPIPRELGNDVSLTELMLYSNCLTGSIPSELGFLSQLLWLELDTNQLTGSMSAELGNLNSLTEFIVHTNCLTGPIPSAFGLLTSLTWLELDTNSLTGSIPTQIGNLVLLTELVLNSNCLTGSIPSELGLVTQLTWMLLYSNCLSGSIPSELGQLSSLSEMILYSNYLNGFIPSHFGALEALIEFELESNYLSGWIPSELGNFRQVHFFDLNSNHLIGPIPCELGKLDSVTELVLYSNQLSGPIPSELGTLSAVHLLFLYSNNLTGTIPSELGNLASLSQLLLDSNRLTGPIPSELGLLSEATQLELFTNSLSGSIPWQLSALSSLQLLLLSSNNLTGCLPTELGAMSSLSVMLLYSNLLNGTIPSELGNLAALTELCLYDNQLTGVIPSEIGKISLLALLELQINCLSGPIPSELDALSSLSVLELYSNSLTGSIPSSLGKANSLTELELYSNCLTGPVPSELGNLAQLISLLLFSNDLTGSLPSELGKLSLCVDLTLSSNHLTGPFVLSTHSLLAAEVISLDYNLFSGAVPSTELLSLQSFNLSVNLFSSSLPATLCENTRVRVMDFSHNQLTGSLPSCLAIMPVLEELKLSNNGLGANLELFFNQAANTTYSLLSVVDISFNRLTGTIPDSAFSLVNMRSLVLSSNCFRGTLPEGLCRATGLTELIMDGLSSSPSCRVTSFQPMLQGVFPKWFMTGSIPSCIWQAMPLLSTLHLSGNGLSGGLGSLSVSSTLADLSLANNKLTGAIPMSFQHHKNFSSLDMSNNRLSGTLSAAFVVSPGQLRLNISLNRLSGEIPQTFMAPSGINVLNGNMFACAGNQLPASDPDTHNYTCGSDGLNDAILAWLSGALLLLIVFVSKVGIIGELLVKECDSATNDVVRCCVWLVAWTAVISSTLFVFLKLGPWQDLYSTHSHQYGWVVSAVYLHGAVPAVCVLALLAVSLFIAFTHLLRIGNVVDSGQSKKSCSSCNVVPRASFRNWKINPRLIIAHVLNAVVVLAVNVTYVYFSLRLVSTKDLLALQLALSVFKIAWRSVSIPNLIAWSGSDFFNTMTMTLLAIIGGPIVSAFFSQSSCFLYAVTGQPAVHSSFEQDDFECVSESYTLCTEDECKSFFQVDCGFSAPTTVNSSIDVGWMYSYQCSSALVMDYIPVFVFSSLSSITAVPLWTWLRSHLLPRMISLSPPPDDKVLFTTTTTKLLLNIALLLTFGLADPLLSCIVGVDCWLIAWSLSRVVAAPAAAAAQNDSSFNKSAWSSELGDAMLPLIRVMGGIIGAFWSLFMLDMLGDEYGSRVGGSCTVIPFVVVWVVLTVVRKVGRGSSATLIVRSDSSSKPTVMMSPMHTTQDLETEF